MKLRLGFMKTTALLLELLRNRAQLWAEGDELCVRAAEGVLTPALREELSRRKQKSTPCLGNGQGMRCPALPSRRRDSSIGGSPAVPCTTFPSR